MTRTRYAIVMAWICLFALTCSKQKDPETPTGPGNPPAQLTLAPASGQPGAPVSVSGLAIDSATLGEYEAQVGGEQAPLKLAGPTGVMMAMPLFADSTGWPAPPAGPQDVTIQRNGTLVGLADTALTVLALPKSPGATASAATALDSIASSFEALFGLVPLSHDWEQPLRDGMVDMFRAMASDGDSSLAAFVNGVPTQDLELIDALVTSSGLLEFIKSYASGLSVTTARLTTATDQSVLCLQTGRLEVLVPDDPVLVELGREDVAISVVVQIREGHPVPLLPEAERGGGGHFLEAAAAVAAEDPVGEQRLEEGVARPDEEVQPAVVVQVSEVGAHGEENPVEAD